MPASFAANRKEIFATGDEKERGDFYDKCVEQAQASGQFLLGQAIFLLRAKTYRGEKELLEWDRMLQKNASAFG